MGCHPKHYWVSMLDAGLSIEKKVPRNPKCSLASSTLFYFVLVRFLYAYFLHCLRATFIMRSPGYKTMLRTIHAHIVLKAGQGFNA
jgi:hypothetical protein